MWSRIILITFLLIPSLHAKEVIKYTVKKGDSLSEILYKLNIGPIYGPEGYQQIFSEMNGLEFQGAKIREGDVLTFPSSVVNKIQAKPEAPRDQNNPEAEIVLESYNVQEPVDVVVSATPVSPLPDQDLGPSIIPEVAPVESAIAVRPTSPEASLETQVTTPATVKTNYEVTYYNNTHNEPGTESSPDEEEGENEGDPYHSLLVSPQISLAQYMTDSEDNFQHNKLKIFTKPVPGLNLQYEMNWNDNFKVMVFTHLSKVSFYKDDNVTYKKSSLSRNNYGLGLGFKKRSSEFAIRAGFFDELYFFLRSLSEVDPVSVSTPEVLFSYRKNMIDYKKMGLKLGLNGKAILPYHTPKLNGEFGYGGGVEVLVGSEKKNLRVFYNQSQANAKNNQTLLSEVGIGFVIEGHFYE